MRLPNFMSLCLLLALAACVEGGPLGIPEEAPSAAPPVVSEPAPAGAAMPEATGSPEPSSLALPADRSIPGSIDPYRPLPPASGAARTAPALGPSVPATPSYAYPARPYYPAYYGYYPGGVPGTYANGGTYGPLYTQPLPGGRPAGIP